MQKPMELEMNLRSCSSQNSAVLVNLLEDELTPLDWRDGARLEFKPFEIISLRLTI